MLSLRQIHLCNGSNKNQGGLKLKWARSCRALQKMQHGLNKGPGSLSLTRFDSTRPDMTHLIILKLQVFLALHSENILVYDNFVLSTIFKHWITFNYWWINKLLVCCNSYPTINNCCISFPNYNQQNTKEQEWQYTCSYFWIHFNSSIFLFSFLISSTILVQPSTTL